MGKCYDCQVTAQACLGCDRNFRYGHTASISTFIPIETFNRLIGSGNTDEQLIKTKYKPAFGSNLRDAARILRKRRER